MNSPGPNPAQAAQQRAESVHPRLRCRLCMEASIFSNNPKESKALFKTVADIYQRIPILSRHRAAVHRAPTSSRIGRIAQGLTPYFGRDRIQDLTRVSPQSISRLVIYLALPTMTAGSEDIHSCS
jgi:hypothetical protein